MKYRKKPVVIEAWHFKKEFQNQVTVTIIPKWVLNAMDSGEIHVNRKGDFCTLEIKTLEGVMVAQPGDYVIQGVKGEIYPCKPDIFEMTYEPVEEKEPTAVTPA